MSPLRMNFGERMLKYRRLHGGTKGGNQTTYYVWIRMRARCLNKNNRDYPDWGGRGITICPEWDSYETFLIDMGPKPGKEYSLDRIDNDGPYSKENCRWATQEEQHNNKRSNRYLTFDGKTQTQAQWAHELGLGTDTLCWRLKHGWTVERALTTPT